MSAAPVNAAPDAASASGARSVTAIGIGAVLASTVFWGIGSSFGAKADLPGVVLSFWRMWIATAMILVVVAVTRRWPTWVDFRRSAPMGVLFGLNICSFFITIEYISTSVALIIGALTPVVALPVAVLFMGERLTAAKVISAVVAVAGVIGAVLAAPASGSADDTTVGYVWAVISLFAWVTYLLASKRVRRKVETVRLLACSSVVGGVTVSVIALVIGADVGQMDGPRWMWISLLALVPGLLGHGVFSWAQPRVDASVSSVLIQAEPVIASFAAWGILGQRVSLLQMLSMGVVVAALGALAWSESRDDTSFVLPEDDPRV
ncbi:MAG: DMT family transporter [Ilumatobacteraceae bacterium]